MPQRPTSPPSDEFDAEALTRLRVILGRIGRQLRQQNPSSESELTFQRIGVLFLVEKLQPVSPGHLAATEGVARPTMTRFLNQLQKKGLITRKPGDGDARARAVVLTEAGEAVCAMHREGRRLWLASKISRLSVPEQRILREALPILEGLLDP